MAKRRKKIERAIAAGEYDSLVGGISALLEQSRRRAAQAVNSILTATYWEIGRRIVEFEQGGESRAEYGIELLKRLGQDLTAKHGRGFSHQGLYKMRSFYLSWEIFPTPSGKLEARVKVTAGLTDSDEICPTLSGKLAMSPAPPQKSQIAQTPSAQFGERLIRAFPLSWSHYVRLMSVEKPRQEILQTKQALETRAARRGGRVTRGRGDTETR